MKVIPLVAIPLGRLLRKRCIVRLESTSEIAEPATAQSLTAMGRRTGRVLGLLFARIQRSVVLHAECIVAPSRQLAAALSDIGVPPAIVREIPNAIDLRKFHAVTFEERTRLRAELALPVSATLLLFAGRLSRAKGIELLVEAWPQIVSRHADLCLVIVGGGEESYDNCEREVIDSIRRFNLGPKRVRMMGMRDDVHRFLQAADLYILPSLYEGFGVGIIEALATGLPVLVTPVGVAPQVIRDGENGFLFPIGDRDSMMRAIEAALSARASWPQIAARARAAVISMDLDSVVRQYGSLIEELLVRKGCGKGSSQLER
jgi:UDP-glucose:(heptosyl)LPS alpha-1,3-glucosyltransferase